MSCWLAYKTNEWSREREGRSSLIDHSLRSSLSPFVEAAAALAVQTDR